MADRSFDRIAAAYEEVRPGYPDELYDRIVAFSGLGTSTRILEVGVGTGKATGPFAARGFQVYGLEPGASLAAIARARLSNFAGVRIEVTSFEDWTIEYAAFGLAFSAQAFHWLKPEERLRRFAAALQRNGTLAIFGNVPDIPGGPVRNDLQSMYEREAPSLSLRRPHERVWYSSQESPITAELFASTEFSDVQFDSFGWERTLGAASYCTLISTYSDHSTLPPAQLSSLLASVQNVIERHGGNISIRYQTGLFLARRAH